ncbi:four-carbon acid sugar kinase family protein [Paenibacillus cymbidii]|uniref:four-carbon acid sugar kinase family protein n=1 Tax=Paenibacillus cymbidii TaxID=1639034 RepID=UPI0014367F05|nr:four-carbon acid sugar kinase family protein [Paenibacillus cymbidii]
MRRKLVIFDDDPTGTQTVADVAVMLRWSKEACRKFMEGDEQTVFVSTNTRALPREQAVALVRDVRRAMEEEAAAAGVAPVFHLRGDSTLRGHVFAELEAIGDGTAASLFVPAFPECGRFTRGGIHYLDDGHTCRPVAETEYAADPVFGYTSVTMADWVNEASGGAWQAVAVPLSRLRGEGAPAIAAALLGAAAGTVVIPDAEREADLHTIAEGLALAEAAAPGRSFAVRSASSLARIRAGLRSKTIDAANMEGAGRLLVVCGSCTTEATRQLRRLTEMTGAEPVTIPTRRVLADGAAAVVPELADRLREALERRQFAIVATERNRSARDGDLASGAQLMAALTGLVRCVLPFCDGIVAKGGITSAQVAADGMMAERAYVCGQLAAGVSLWQVATPGGRVLPYAVVPGNVGGEHTLADIARKFGKQGDGAAGGGGD